MKRYRVWLKRTNQPETSRTVSVNGDRLRSGLRHVTAINDDGTVFTVPWENVSYIERRR